MLTFGISGGKGIWKSTDGGITWTLTTAGVIDEDVSVTDLVIDPTNPDRLFAAVGELTGSSDQNGVYKTDNGGRSWEFAGDFPLGDFQGKKTAIKLAIAPSNTQTLYAVIAGRPDPIGGTSPFAIYKTADGGETWRPTPLPAEIRGNAYTSTVAVDPSDDSVVYVCNEKRDWSMMLSADGGQSWTDIHHGRNRITPHVDHRGIGFDADFNLLDGDDGGLFRYDRYRAIWTDLNTDQQTSFFLSIAQHPTDPEMVYGGGFDNGANRTRRGHPLVWDGLRPGDLTTVRLDPSYPNIVYSQLGGVSLQRSDDGGRHWEDKVDGIVFTDRTQTPPFVIDPRNPKRLVLATDQLYESLNRADTWTAFGTPLPQSVDSIALAPDDDDTLYVSAAGSLYSSSDRGVSWTLGFSGTRSDRFRSIAVSERNKEIAFAVRMGLDHGNVFMTTNGGLDWRDISGNLPNASVNAIALDPRARGDILDAALDGGVFVTHDLGRRWTRFGAGLPNASVRALDISTRFNLLVAGTNGRGAWRIRIAAPTD